MFTPNVGVDVPVTCRHAVVFDASRLFGFLKLQNTRAYLAASEGFLIAACNCTTLLTTASGGSENETNERLMPRMTFIVLLALKVCCSVAEAQSVEALTLHLVTFQMPTVFTGSVILYVRVFIAGMPWQDEVRSCVAPLGLLTVQLTLPNLSSFTGFATSVSMLTLELFTTSLVGTVTDDM